MHDAKDTAKAIRCHLNTSTYHILPPSKSNKLMPKSKWILNYNVCYLVCCNGCTACNRCLIASNAWDETLKPFGVFVWVCASVFDCEKCVKMPFNQLIYWQHINTFILFSIIFSPSTLYSINMHSHKICSNVIAPPMLFFFVCSVLTWASYSFQWMNK